jgi:hypothetical protein
MMKVPLVDSRGHDAVTRSEIRGAIEGSLNLIPWKSLPTFSLLVFMPDESFFQTIIENSELVSTWLGA